MPSPVFTNKDLNKPMAGPQKSRTYTNADLPSMRAADDFEPDDFEPDVDAGTTDDFTPDEVPQVTSGRGVGGGYPIPDTFEKGFINSILNGEALDTGMKGAKGWLRGATTDIPGTIMGGIKSIYDGVKESYNGRNIPLAIRGAKTREELGAQLNNQTPMGNPLDSMTAGAEPEEFGRTMGQITGQPLTTAGLVRGAPGAIRGAGKVVETGGRIMRRHQPVTGFIPRMVEPRIARVIEKAVGSKIENAGRRMGNVRGPESSMFSKEPLQGEVMPEPRPLNRPELPPSRTSFYNKSSYEPLDNRPMVDRVRDIQTRPEGKYESFIPAAEGELIPATLEEEISNIVNQRNTPVTKATKPKARLNPDGTYTNLDTGEVFDSTGKPMAAPIDKNSDFFRRKQTKIEAKDRTIDNAPPNQRAKIMRGMNDPVDVLFEDSNSRDIFGAGASSFVKGQPKAGAMQRLGDTAKRVATEYNIPEQTAQKMVVRYNAHIKELSKNIPKSGEGLNFKAPSFTQFMKAYKD